MSRLALSHVERLAFDLPSDQQLELLEHLASHLRQGMPAGAPLDLYGAWKDRFPDEFDVDTALTEIRAGWQSDELK
jgi:hypothetical protein